MKKWLNFIVPSYFFCNTIDWKFDSNSKWKNSKWILWIEKLRPYILDYSKMNTPDHFLDGSSIRKPIFNFKRSLNMSSEDSVSFITFSQPFAKDYLENLEQNLRAALLFEKNNFLVLGTDVTELMQNYFSLH